MRSADLFEEGQLSGTGIETVMSPSSIPKRCVVGTKSVKAYSSPMGRPSQCEGRRVAPSQTASLCTWVATRVYSTIVRNNTSFADRSHFCAQFGRMYYDEPGDRSPGSSKRWRVFYTLR